MITKLDHYAVVSEEALENIIRNRWHLLPADRHDHIKQDMRGAIFECRTAFVKRMQRYLDKDVMDNGEVVWISHEHDFFLVAKKNVDKFCIEHNVKATFRWKE